MKSIAVIVGLLGLVGGCGSGPLSGCDPGWGPAVNNADVCCPLDELFVGSDGVCYTSSAREACDDDAVPDEDLEAALTILRLTKNDGLSASAALDEGISGCIEECAAGDSGCESHCVRCITAIVGAIYR